MLGHEALHPQTVGQRLRECLAELLQRFRRQLFDEQLNQ
jgi:hypothetical protein